VIKGAASALLAIFVAIACQSGQSTSSSPDIIIASDIPITSFESELIWDQAIAYVIGHQPTLEGYRLGYWSLDNALGGSQSQIRARENTKRVIADRRVLGMVGPFSSFLAKVEVPQANIAHLAMVSPSTTGDCLTVAQRRCPSPTAADLRPTNSNNFFRISPRDPEQGTAVAYYAASRLGLKRVAAFNKPGGQGDLYIQKFSDEFRRLGGTLVYQAELPGQLDDFTGFLSHARNLGVDAIFAVGGVEQHTCKAAAQLAALLPGAIFLSTDNLTLQPGCIADMGVSHPQVFASLGAVDPATSSDPAVKNAVAAYLNVHPFRFDSTGYTAYVFAAYDCARILIEAIRRAIQNDGEKFPSRADVVAALTQPPDFVGLTGKYSFDMNGDAINPMMSIYKVEAGRWKFVEVLNLGSA